MSKSSSTSRHSSPRAMPVETIITRFKSAQQKRQLREMDRSMTKVTELLKSPLKPKIKKKDHLKKTAAFKRLGGVISKDVEVGKRKRSRSRSEKDVKEEYCPLKLKRHIVLSKVCLKPKHELKIIAQTNKRKRTLPKKGIFAQDSSELSIDSDSVCEVSPKAKQSKLHQDMSMDEMIQLIEDSGSLNDEDLLEILTCPSPVWWEDPPDGYIEDALFTRPRSTAEMYPSIRSQLQENFQERQRSSTPNVLSRREKIISKSKSEDKNNSDVTKKQKYEPTINNNDINLDIALSKCDERFIKKRSKLESLLGNLKNKTINYTSKVMKPVEVTDCNHKTVTSGNLPNQVSVIKNLCSKEVVKGDSKSKIGLSDVQLEDKEKPAPVLVGTDSESTDDERLTDISFQDDAYLNDLENMEIPMQPNIEVLPKKENEDKRSEKCISSPVIKNNAQIVSKVSTDNEKLSPNCEKSTFNKCRALNFKDGTIDPTYRNKKSSIIEDYFEMNLIEEDTTVVKDQQRKCSKSEFKSVKKSKNDSKQKENNLKTSVIKFKNSDNTSINVLKIESVVPKNLPPLKNSSRRMSTTGCMPENLPPLRRNPVVINLNSESPESSKSSTSYVTTDSSVIQDNMDSISDTNICFLNEDDDVCEEKKMDSCESEGAECKFKKSNNGITNLPTILRSNKSPHSPSQTPIIEFEETKCNDNIFQTNELNFTKGSDLYRNFTQINGVIASEFNKLEFQSLTITKVNDNNCCKGEKKIEAVRNKKSISNCDAKQKGGIDLPTFEPTIYKQKEFNNSLIHNEIGKIENENSECITVYKIVSDDSGNDEPKNEVCTPKSLKYNIKDLKDTTDDSVHDKTSDSNRDKMIFYFKKCKNLYWKNKTLDKIEDKKLSVKENELVHKTDSGMEHVKHEDSIDNVKNIEITSTGSSDENKELKNSESNKIETNNAINHNNNLTTDTKEQKCINISDTKKIRYCKNCSSIFDTTQCNYCNRKNNADNKKQCATDYLSKIQECFICDVCRFKAFSKYSLKRHIMSHSCDSKHR